LFGGGGVNGGIHRETHHGDLISLLLFFQNKENGLTGWLLNPKKEKKIGKVWEQQLMSELKAAVFLHDTVV
jgi:hypothetical protein